MKKFVTLALIAVLAILVVGNVALAAYRDGEFVGVVEDAAHGHVVIAVGIVKGQVANVEILSPVKFKYSYEQGKKAFFEYPAKVVAKQSAKVDVVAGATSSYKTYNQAVQMALDTAAGTYKGNKFYGLSRDYGHGHIVVEVTLNAAKSKIDAVRFITATGDEKLKDQETLMANKAKGYPYAAGKTAFETFPGKVVKGQKLKVDAVSGATHSNTQFYWALLQALEAAEATKNFDK